MTKDLSSSFPIFAFSFVSFIHIINATTSHPLGYYKKKSVGKDVDKLEQLCTAGGHVKWCREYVGFLKN